MRTTEGRRAVEVAVASSVGEHSIYHYAPPPRDSAPLQMGCLVHVPFGTRDLPGIVLSPDVPAEGDFALKPIRAVLDHIPVITPSGLALARWIADYYSCPLSEVMATMLPPGLSRRTVYHIGRTGTPCSTPLTSVQNGVLALVPPYGEGTVALERLTHEGGRTAATAVTVLIKKGVLTRTATLRKMGARTVRMASWSGVDGEGKRIGPKGRAVLSLLQRAEGPLSVAELGRHVSGAATALPPLQRQGLVVVTEETVRRDPVAHRSLAPTASLPLNEEQQDALNAIVAALEAGRSETFLLHGVTGSGKTEVYLQALAATVARGRQGIILTPEISLTPQTMDRFAARFPGRVALLHSALSDGERVDEWERARAGTVDAVVGARSAIFSPLPSIGLIVLDEEHDASYKQDRAPRYHTREAARRLARESGAVVILGSATPDVTSYYNALEGTYHLLTMTQRAARPQGALAEGATHSNSVDGGGGDPRVGAGQAPGLPPVEIVDLRQELHAGNRSIFSRQLQDAVREGLAKREQIILFLNRRGAATFVICRDCGYVVHCPACDLPFTYHSSTEDLVCHRCDRRESPPTTCLRCGGWRIRYFGLGVQRVEDEARRQFPGARLLRWDRDVLSGKHGHEHALDRFARGEADILVGTQMVAKGLDIPRVTVVGVISADTALNLPDFRSAERTFQTLTQVAGRAGRHALPGRVVVQTYAPEHFAIQAAAAHDYALFYAQELPFRLDAGYPPASQLLKLVYTDEDEEVCREASDSLASTLRRALGLVRNGEVIGPAPCFIGKVDGRRLWQVLVRADNVHPLLNLVPPGWTRDVDPISLL